MEPRFCEAPSFGVPKPVHVNVRALAAPLTGVQRYVQELVARLGAALTPVTPGFSAQGVRGHAWEQMRLPGLVGGALLWSPANTGPLAVRQQVVTIHDLATLDHPEWYSTRFAGWYRFLLPRLVPRVVRVIAVSEFTKSRLLETCRLRDEQVVVVHNGVDRRFRPDAATHADEALDPLGLRPDAYLLSLCSVEPRKNLARLLAAWERALPVLPPEVTLVLAGAMGQAHVFGRYSLGRLPSRVRLLGAVPDAALPALYASARAFLYPSLYEGFGMPPLEAMAAGTPTLTSNRSALPEVTGDAALHVDPEDVDAMALGIVRLAMDAPLRAELHARGIRRAGQFTWDRAASAVSQVLNDAING